MKQELLNRINNLIDVELKDCTDDVYPTLCRMKQTDVGLAKIRKMVMAVITETPMGVGSALAQIESSYT